MSRDQLVSWFQECYPSICEEMRNTDHTYVQSNPNKYHAEGTVWTHTMMVMTWIEATVFDSKKEVLLLTALLHDIGKPKAQEFIEADGTRPDRYRFAGHEGISTMLAIQILKRYQIHRQLTDWDLEDILYLISTHGEAIPEGCYLETHRRIFRGADKGGAIRRVDESNKSLQYKPHRYAKRTPTHGKELIILTGLPCSGKSTYVESLKDCTIVSRDSLIIEFVPEATSYNEAYRIAHSTEESKNALNKAFDAMVNKAIHKDKVVIDMTMMSLSARRTMLNRFNKHIAHSKVFLTDMKIIRKRNTEREGKDIPDFVLNNMSKSFIIPTVEEGFKTVELIVT